MIEVQSRINCAKIEAGGETGVSHIYGLYLSHSVHAVWHEQLSMLLTSWVDLQTYMK